MIKPLLRFAIAGFMLVAASPGSAAKLFLNGGITISLRKVSTLPPGQLVCTGVCFIGTNADVTVWQDGEVLNNGQRSRISRDEAAQFRRALLPFPPNAIRTGGSTADALSKLCPVQIQWPADDVRPVTCGDYGVAGMHSPVFEGILRAFGVIHLDMHLNQNGYLTL